MSDIYLALCDGKKLNDIPSGVLTKHYEEVQNASLNAIISTTKLLLSSATCKKLFHVMISSAAGSLKPNCFHPFIRMTLQHAA
ncbi:unnamed protein product [Echinostoma caproni]|uniref:Myosin motor domain-containing protein n=1 Tax=Echinostoma caproni TaxID=27848 RepID=A0A183AE90_9TREM|nr:unnamed protein product [Echinostoma caproni]